MPLDEAALDAFLASDGAPAAPDTTETTGADTAPVDETPAHETDTDTADTLTDQDKFDRAYVEKLRKESANYRERAKRYQEAFDGYEDEQVQEWLRLARSLREDPRSTAAEFEALAQQIKDAYSQSEQDTETQTKVPEGYLTKAEVEAMFQEREREADLQRRVAAIESEAKDLGYEKGTEDYDLLLWEASRLPSGSIHEAHAKIEARNQAIYDRMIAKLNERPNPNVQNAAPAVGDGGERPKDFDSAAAALDAWLASRG